MRPVTLKIAVGPPNSEDVKVIQALAHTFARERGYIRLKVVPTENASASANALEHKGVDLAVIRGDLDVPKDAASVAVMRKNLVVLWVPSAGKGKKHERVRRIKKIQISPAARIGVIGKTSANVNLLNVILRQYGVDPAKVEVTQFSTNEVAEATEDPEGRCIPGRGAAQQQDHGGRTPRRRKGGRRADLPRHRCG